MDYAEQLAIAEQHVRDGLKQVAREGEIGGECRRSATGSFSFPCRVLPLILVLKERLLEFTMNADEPFFCTSGTVPKIVCLPLKFARPFFGCPQFGGKTVGKVQSPLAVGLRQIGRFLHQGDNPMPRVIGHQSSF
jgi:hypothetical protein